MPGVYLNEDDYNFDIALRRFKKQVEKAGILSEMKKRQHFEKPSVMRKKKKAAARKRLMKKMRKGNAAYRRVSVRFRCVSDTGGPHGLPCLAVSFLDNCFTTSPPG